MDLGFTRLDSARAEPAPMPPDYGRLIASLAAMQAAGRTAVAEARLAAGTFTGDEAIAALVEIYAAGPGWAAAAAWLEGRFHPDTAAKLRQIAPECE
ncbi:hypothetical protein [Sphingomonas solaris]|uniref:Uncharacterized protein n=1 Tax=Alterirhizorhabdus solaris TaxID=2529389 RepID=A0A558QYA5_9SPHN|nr:hypothetical protein [Sphingomonas solaris]TVV72062.1 hypothetical protein FOY91_15475 [Sphingomonas solaris]